MLTVEVCAKLTASRIPYKGRTVIESGGRRFGIVASPRAVGVVSGRFYQGIPRVKLPFGGRAHGGFAVWFRCECGRKVPTLYLPPNGTRFACRYCLRLRYAAWKQDGSRPPKKPHLWFEWLMRKSRRVLGREVVENV